MNHYDSPLSKTAEGRGAPAVTSLTAMELRTPLWRKHRADLQRRLEMLTNRLCQPQNEVETALLRGRIAEIKTQLAFDHYVERTQAVVHQDPLSGYLDP